MTTRHDRKTPSHDQIFMDEIDALLTRFPDTPVRIRTQKTSGILMSETAFNEMLAARKERDALDAARLGTPDETTTQDTISEADILDALQSARHPDDSQ